MTDFRYGAVIKVQREHTLEKIFSMLDKMKAIGMNTVVIWPAVYWWEDKNSPNYPYQTGHEILSYAEKIDMKVVMELAGQIPCLEYAPDFAIKDDHFAITEDGKRNYEGAHYGYYNFNHPEVKQLIEKNYREIALNYKGYSSLFGYDVWNETVFNSYDRYTLELFKKWLMEKYGTIEKLNDSWDRSFFDWSQIEFAKWLWASVMPKVDLEEFRKDNIGIILDFMKECIKAIDDTRPIIADNVFSMTSLDLTYDRAQDDWNVAERADIYGMDIYPKFGQMTLTDYTRWQTFVGAHSANKTGKFWVSELQTHHGLMIDVGAYVYPNEIRKWCWEAISHGAKGLIFWKWDPFNKGMQTYGRGLVDFKGEYTPRALEAGSVAKIIAENEKEFSEYLPGQPRVAILFDRLSYDFMRTLTGLNHAYSFYLDSMIGLYKCLWEQNITAKFITDRDILENDISSYKTIFISNHVNISPELTNALNHYVEQGGVIVADGKFGEISNTGIVYEQIPGAGFHNTAGFEILDMRPNNLGMTLVESVFGEPLTVEGYFDKRDLQLVNSDLDIWASYSDGSPAILHSKHGKGEIVYLSTMFWCGYLKVEQTSVQKFMSYLDRKYSLRSFKISNDTLKVCTLNGEDGYLVFAFNYTETDSAAKVELHVDQDGKYQVTSLYLKEEIIVNASNGKLLIDIKSKTKDVEIYKVKRI